MEGYHYALIVASFCVPFVIYSLARGWETLLQKWRDRDTVILVQLFFLATTFAVFVYACIT